MKAPEYEGPVVYAGGNKVTVVDVYGYEGCPCAQI